MSEPGIRRQRWQFIQWPLIWALVLVAFALGWAGFAKLAEDIPLSTADCIYGTLQLFVLGGSFPDGLNWQLEIARFLAPGVMAYTATQALIVLFHEQLSLLILRFTRGHIIVCGLGRTGFKIAADFLRQGEKVVVIEEESESDWIAMARELGATVLIGDATEPFLLAQARAGHARMLVVVCGNDGINVEVAIRAYGLKCATRGGPVLECHIHIVEEDLRALFKEHRVFTDTGDRCRVILFNLYDSSARLTLRQHPLDRQRIGPGDPRTVHLIIIGFGQMGQSLILHAARIGHFANDRRLRITVMDRDPAPRQRRLRRRHPQLDSVCDVTFLPREADDLAALAEIASLCAAPHTLATVAVCLDDDTRGLSLALALLPHLRPTATPILLRMTTDGGLTTLLDADIATTRLADLVKPFPMLGLSSDSEILLHREMDAGAIAAHTDYIRKRSAVPHDHADPSLHPWEELDEDLKDSNRQQADHLEVKLRALGLTATAGATGTPFAGFSEEEIETLARMEHARWNADRYLAGWTHAPGKKSIELKTTPWLIPYDELPDEIREYDRETVRNIPNLVALSGRHIVQAAAN